MRDHFEVRDHDAAGRIGRLTVPRAGVTVETPALLPVVNPNVLTIEPTRLEEEFGAEMLITNSYILHGSDELVRTGIAVDSHLFGVPVGLSALDTSECFNGLFDGLLTVTATHPFDGQRR